VNQYPHLPRDCGGRSCDLNFPVADASEFVRAVAERSAPLHAQMEALLLVNREALEADDARAGDIARIVGDDRIIEPEARSIRDEIVDFLDLPGPDDTTIVFVAGHGINVDEDYYVLPTDARKQDGDRWRRSSLVAWSDIHEAIERARGRRPMLLDTCHAAGAFNAKLEKEAADARIVVLAATATNNTAAELADLGHGAFTWSVLEGIRGAANTGGDGVRILGLSDYVDREVRRLTGERQQPFYHLPRTENFLVARR
ncbi:MAG: caspase family protein, partial [Sphingomonadaceae bacterium]|nr:caspase family protein [Sphingomonadaceae bacterium]